jgi:hypothetical protein
VFFVAVVDGGSFKENCKIEKEKKEITLMLNYKIDLWQEAYLGDH